MAPRKARRDRPFVIAEELTLDEWLRHVLIPDERRKVLVADYRFATDGHKEEYLRSIQTRSDREIRTILRNFLIPSGSIGGDGNLLKFAIDRHGSGILEAIQDNEFLRRLLRRSAWEGITWVLDLLPNSARLAIDALQAYWRAHLDYLPDGRMDSLEDAQAVIRQKYLFQPNPREALQALHFAEFENLIGRLFREMGYEATVTKPSKDGGVDIVARLTDVGSQQLLLIQCKRQSSNVGVKALRELTGIVSRMQANRGMIVATAGYTRAARDEAKTNSIVELVSYDDLSLLLNRYLGPRWPLMLTYYVQNPRGLGISAL